MRSPKAVLRAAMLSGLRTAATTWSPAARAASANARPSPFEAPVMIQVCDAVCVVMAATLGVRARSNANLRRPLCAHAVAALGPARAVLQTELKGAGAQVVLQVAAGADPRDPHQLRAFGSGYLAGGADRVEHQFARLGAKALG